jgi:hypothetical protein
MRIWLAFVFLTISLAVEAFLDAPTELFTATTVATILCFIVFALYWLRHSDYRTYDIIRIAIQFVIFIFVFLLPLPFYLRVVIFLAIMIPLNIFYPDRHPSDD